MRKKRESQQLRLGEQKKKHLTTKVTKGHEGEKKKQQQLPTQRHQGHKGKKKKKRNGNTEKAENG